MNVAFRTPSHPFRRRCCVTAGALLLLAVPGAALAAEGGAGGSITVFVAQVVVLLALGRLLGEAAQRIGQPAVMGQLIAGVILGPSVLGAVLPELQHMLFPDSREQKSMLDAVAQLGVLLLLLLTGMETDLSLIRKVRRAAFSVSVAGIAVPFACGFALGEMLPDSMLPNPATRLLTSLFLGVALSISSVKIVAAVVREMSFMRRNVGQVIMAAAIIDDTIGWIIIAVIFGLAMHGGVDLAVLAQSVLGTLLFLALSFTLGRRLVSFLIRWSNDNFIGEVPVITTIIVIMGLMALMTQAIGVHTVLGAFVAGILVGQSPILTRHIDEELRGLITALFMPIFFGLAGLSADLSIVKDPAMMALGLGLILIASVGKFAGAFIGGSLGGLSRRESLALACGMNARGSTEVIVATIGLSLGVLSRDLFSLIVAMAVITTMAMPPMLRWALARLPLRPEEAARLEREEFEAKGFVFGLERLLVAADKSADGMLASRLVGLLAGARRTPMTIVDVAVPAGTTPARPGESAAADAGVAASANGGTVAPETVAKEAAEGAKPDAERRAPPAADVTTRKTRGQPETEVAAEAKKGYDLMTVGVDGAIGDGGAFSDSVTRMVGGFEGPLAIVTARGPHRADPVGYPLNILVPINGAPHALRAGEIALAIARAHRTSVTALYVAQEAGVPSWQHRLGTRLAPLSEADAILKQFGSLADSYGVPLQTAVRASIRPGEAVLQQIRRGDHNLVVVGVSLRSGDTLSLGPLATLLAERGDRSILYLSS